ncbi:EEF1A lysine methyltransferase 1 [Balamuthia mandrillaris]
MEDTATTYLVEEFGNAVLFYDSCAVGPSSASPSAEEADRPLAEDRTSAAVPASKDDLPTRIESFVEEEVDDLFLATKAFAMEREEEEDDTDPADGFSFSAVRRKLRAPKAKLSSSTLAVLQEFLKEQEELDKKEREQMVKEGRKKKQKWGEEGSIAAEQETSDSKEFVGAVRENWQLSQFWYSEETAMLLAEEALQLCPPLSGQRVACISTPTIFRAIQQLPMDSSHVFLFEYDKRFADYGEQFQFYDYNEPLNVPAHFHHTFDCLFVDPPFLAEECLTKTLQTVALLSRNTDTKLIVLTGGVMEDVLVRNGPPGMQRSSWAPQHKHGLRNNFSCFLNYPSPRLR